MIGLEQILMRILIAGDMKIWVYFNGKKYFLSFIVQYLQKEDWIRLNTYNSYNENRKRNTIKSTAR